MKEEEREDLQNARDELISQVFQSFSQERVIQAQKFFSEDFGNMTDEEKKEIVYEFIGLKMQDMGFATQEKLIKMGNDLDHPNVVQTIDAVIENIQNGKDMFILLNTEAIDPLLFPSMYIANELGYSEGADRLLSRYTEEFIDKVFDAGQEGNSVMAEFIDSKEEFRFVPTQEDVDRYNEYAAENGYPLVKLDQIQFPLYLEQMNKELEKRLQEDAEEDFIDLPDVNLNDLIGDMEEENGLIGDMEEENGLIGDLEKEKDLIGDLEKEKDLIDDLEEEKNRDQLQIHRAKQQTALIRLLSLHNISTVHSTVEEVKMQTEIYNSILEEYRRLGKEGPDEKYSGLEDKEVDELRELDPWRRPEEAKKEVKEEKQEEKQKENKQEIQEVKEEEVKEEKPEEKQEEILEVQREEIRVEKQEEIKQEIKEEIKEEKQEEVKEEKEEEDEFDNINIENEKAQNDVARKIELENFFSKYGGYKTTPRDERVKVIKDYLAERAVQKYNHQFPEDQNQKDCYKKFLSTNAVAVQLIEDIVDGLDKYETFKIIRDNHLFMRLAFDGFDEDKAVQSSQTRAQRANDWFYSKNAKLRNVKNKRFFGDVLNPAATVGELQQVCEKKLAEAKENPFEINNQNKVKAADLIFAEMLTHNRSIGANGYFGKAANEKICQEGSWNITDKDFEYTEPKKSDKNMDLKAYNARMDSMRRRMLQKDESFREILKKGGTSQDFVKRYRAEWKRKTERLANMENELKQEAPEDKERFTLSGEDRKFFEEIHHDMLEFNEKKVRKGVNEAMMKELKNVLDKDTEKQLTLGDMKKLRYASAHYYQTRKGTFMEPVTQAGKDRLRCSAYLVEKTSEMIRDFQEQKKMNVEPKVVVKHM